jgi:hypothetical protein
MSNESLVQQIYQDLLAPGYLAKIPMFYHPQVVLEINGETANYQDIVQRAQFRQQHYVELRSDVQTLLIDHDKLAIKLTQQWQDKAGKTGVLHGTIVYQIQQGKVIKAWGNISPNFTYKVNA